MAINISDWIKGTTTSQGNDPTEWNGKNTPCNLCYKDAEINDDYCEDHQRCVMCGDNDDCECKDEWSGVSSCCEARMDTEQKMCYKCHDHCDSVWETENEKS